MEIYDEKDKIILRIYDSLKNVIDPELDINIIDMGLVYDVRFVSGSCILVTMTLSSKGCPMGEIIVNDISDVLRQEFPQYEHKIDLTWTPKWSADFITPAGKKLLGIS